MSILHKSPQRAVSRGCLTDGLTGRKEEKTAERQTATGEPEKKMSRLSQEGLDVYFFQEAALGLAS